MDLTHKQLNECYGFVGWGNRLRYAPLATFGVRVPTCTRGLLVCSDPPMADSKLTNAEELTGNIVLVERGSCTFPDKARRVQEAGAIGMIVANNEADSPSAAFTMGEIIEGEAKDIGIPCAMLSFENVRDLLVYAHQTDSAMVSLEILNATEAAIAASKEKKERACSIEQVYTDLPDEGNSVWSKFFEQGTTFLKYIEDSANSLSKDYQPVSLDDSKEEIEEIDDSPIFAFLRCPASAYGYHLHYSPMAEFGPTRHTLPYQGKLVFCDPPLADTDSIKNAAEMRENIAIVERGKCTFPEKLERLQNIGVKAAIVANNDVNDPDSAFVMSVDHVSADHIQIPAVMISYKVAEKLRAYKPNTVSIFCLRGDSAGILLGKDPSHTYSLTSVPDVYNGTPPLHNACRLCETNIVNDMIENGESIHKIDALLLTPLHHACIGGDVTIVNQLLESGAKHNMEDLGGQTPLHFACLQGHTDIVETLIESHANVSTYNSGMQSPLHLACITGNTTIIELLITANASVDQSGKYIFNNVNDKDLDSCTPLHYACKHGHVDCILYLVAANACMNIIDIKGLTPLHYICKQINAETDPKPLLQVVEKMMSNGARMMKNSDGDLPIDLVLSKSIRRELEVCYLRKEVIYLRDQLNEIRSEKETLQNMVAEYVGEHITNQFKLQEATKEREEIKIQLQNQRVHIQQMQNQLKTVLQYMQSSSSSSSTTSTNTFNASLQYESCEGSNTNPSTSLLSHGDHQHNIGQKYAFHISEKQDFNSESELAEESALCRDIAKKYSRNKDNKRAVEYFRKSLELYPLPGVQRMLDRVQTLLEEEETLKAEQRAALRKEETKDMLMNRYRKRLQEDGVPESAVNAIELEIENLKQLEEGSSEFILARDWLDWLLSLPWDINGSDQTFGMDMFKQLQVVEQEAIECQQREAAIIIQRAIREYLSYYHWEKELAATCIQKCIRHYLRQHQFYKPDKYNNNNNNTDDDEEEEDETNTLSTSSISDKDDDLEMNLSSSEEPEKDDKHQENQIDLSENSLDKNSKQPYEMESEQYMTLLDSYIPNKMKSSILIRGIKLSQPPTLQENHLDVHEKFHIIQILHLKETNSLYVWNRWGIVGMPCQSALKGPYDWYGAQHEYVRKYKEKTKNEWGIDRNEFIAYPKSYKPLSWWTKELENKEQIYLNQVLLKEEEDSNRKNTIKEDFSI